jgi:hypothetical protein
MRSLLRFVCVGQTRWWPASLILTLLVGSSAPASAQEPVRSFEELNTRLKVGDTVWVTDAQGRETKGTVLGVTPGELVLDGGRSRTFGSADVRAVRERAGRSLGKATLWGTVAGAGTGLVLAVAVRGEFASYCTPEQAAAGCFPPPGAKPPIDWWVVPVYAGVGAGIGVLVGALLPGRQRDVYLAPRDSARLAPRAQLWVAPALAPRRTAVAVLLSF